MNGIAADDAEAIIDHISQSVVDNAIDIARNPPEILKNHPACLHALRCVTTEIFWNSDAPTLPDWKDQEVAVPEDYVDTAKPVKPATTTLAFNGTRPSFDL